MNKIKTYKKNRWEWFVNPKFKDMQITGKYLFFSPDREILREIAVKELRKHQFPMAKIPMEEKKIGSDYVLCLYFKALLDPGS